jgi:hypothetical protein
MDFSEDDLLAFMKTYLPEEKLFHKDPSRYITKRRETELWLYTAFLQKGGRPLCSKPIYMTLGKSCYIERLGIYTECVKFPISSFTPDSLSFTYTDSYVSRWLAETTHECFDPSLHGKVFTLSEVLILLSDTTFNIDENINRERYNFFIEAQIWDRAPLQGIGPPIH